MSKNDNILNRILDLYPDVWREHSRFKALLADFLPQDKLKRNLIMICMDERIPSELYQKDVISSFEYAQYKKKLINACGCSSVLAGEIIDIWLEAFSIDVEINDGRDPEIKFEYEIIDDTVKVTGFIGKSKEVVIPECIEDKNVTSIGTGLFFYNMALYKNYREGTLVKVSLPNTLKRIERIAFKYGINVEICLPEGLEYIGASAFEGTLSGNLHIPSTVNKIEEGAFTLCRKLHLSIDERNRNYKIVDGVLYDVNLTTILFWPYDKEFSDIPQTVYRIGESILNIDSDEVKESELSEKEIIIPAHIKEIGAFCFRGQDKWKIRVHNQGCKVDVFIIHPKNFVYDDIETVDFIE